MLFAILCYYCSVQKKFLIILVVALLLAIPLFAYGIRQQKLASISSFAACKNAGYEVMESFPPQCVTPDGRHFTDTIRPQAKEVSGEFVCLSHRNTSGPQTMECALGLKGDDGNYYGVNDTDPNYSNVSGLGTGAKVKIKGKFTPQPSSKYNSIGNLSIENLEQL